jgi:hypothetical protein
MIIHMNDAGLAVAMPVKNCAGNLKSMILRLLVGSSKEC